MRRNVLKDALTATTFNFNSSPTMIWNEDDEHIHRAEGRRGTYTTYILGAFVPASRDRRSVRLMKDDLRL